MIATLLIQSYFNVSATEISIFQSVSIVLMISSGKRLHIGRKHIDKTSSADLYVLYSYNMERGIM